MVLNGSRRSRRLLFNPSHWLHLRRRYFGRRTLVGFLPLEDAAQQIYILDGKPEDLVFAQFFIWRMRRNQSAKLSECAAHVLLSPSLASIGEEFFRRLATPPARCAH